jgi:hypothetical protein
MWTGVPVDFHEAEEFRGEVFMHADAAVGARVMFHPAGVEAVGWFELAPVGHGGAFEGPACGRLARRLFDLVAIVGVTVGIGAFFLLLVEDAEASGGVGLDDVPTETGMASSTSNPP